MAVDTKSVNWLALCSTWIVRIFFWVTAIYLVYYCTLLTFTYPTLHVILSTIACALIMVEAILVVTGDAYLAVRLSKVARVRLHWILHILALATVIAGLWAIMVHKNAVNFPHWATDHGKLGLVSIILSVFVNISAIPTLHKNIVPKFVNFGSFKRFHIYFGLVTFILLGASQITGVTKEWWIIQNIGGGSVLSRQLTLAAYGIGGFLLLAKPTYSTLKRSFAKSS